MTAEMNNSGHPGQRNGLQYEEAVKLLHHYGKNHPWVSHCFAVSKLAGHCGRIFAERLALDLDFLKTASLLHDIGRYKTHDPIMHGVEGYRLLDSLGFGREAFVCASHIMSGLSLDEAVRFGLPPQDFVPRTFEEKLVPVIDCLVEFDRPTTPEKRFASIRRRYAGNDYFLWKIDRAAEEVGEFISRIEEEFMISMRDIAFEVL